MRAPHATGLTLHHINQSSEREPWGDITRCQSSGSYQTSNNIILLSSNSNMPSRTVEGLLMLRAVIIEDLMAENPPLNLIRRTVLRLGCNKTPTVFQEHSHSDEGLSVLITSSEQCGSQSKQRISKGLRYGYLVGYHTKKAQKDLCLSRFHVKVLHQCELIISL